MKQLIALFVFSTMLFAQENNSPQNELSKLTTEQKLDVAVSNSMSYMIMGISYAKSLGKTPEEFAEHSADLVIPAYQSLKGKEPFQLMDIMNRVQQTDKNFVLEINKSSDSSVSGRMSLFGINNIKAARGAGGVTEDDCYMFYNTFVKTLSAGIGLDYKYSRNGDWIEFELSKK